ncbi:hypothetical protein BY996DRAFT_8488588, partial [Phakopsora pachyrhizi]
LAIYILSSLVPSIDAHLSLLPTIPLSPRVGPTNPNIKTSNFPTDDVVNKNTTSDDCAKRKQSTELWNNLKMNDYLRNYPGGESLTLKEYAFSVGANNFNFKIGSHCRLEQLCNEVKGRDWYALVAAQRWNIKMNQAFDAIAFASTTATEVSETMIFDFIPAPSKSWLYATTIVSAIFWVTLSIPGIWFGPVGRYYYRGLLSAFYATMGIMRPISTFGHPTASHAFTQWSEMASLVAQIKKNSQQALVNLTEEVYNAGISTDKGLYGINTDGHLFSQHEMLTESDMQAHFDKAFRLQILSQIWILQKAFIIRGGNACNGDGINGAMTGKDFISYCSPEGIMMNVVRTEKKKIKRKIYGADKSLSSHGFTAEFLTTSAWKCQQNFGRVTEPTSWQNASEKDNEILLSDDCIFVLPVCDLTRSDIKAEVKKGKNIINVCQRLANLSI